MEPDSVVIKKMYITILKLIPFIRLFFIATPYRLQRLISTHENISLLRINLRVSLRCLLVSVGLGLWEILEVKAHPKQVFPTVCLPFSQQLISIFS